ncbi:MFS general substrate transporter [Colletotrichum sublineola]|nr:MFS general substrate transporter [Colletotrichum sublineola]
MFLVSRFILSFSLVFTNAYTPMLIGELAHPKERQVTFGTFAIQSEWSWRIPSLLQAAPALVPICCVFLLPESPQWLIANGRADEAMAMLVKWHANRNPTTSSQWSGNGLVSYYLVRVLKTVGINDPHKRNILNRGILAIFASQTLCSSLFNKEHNLPTSKAVIALLFLFYLFYNLAFNVLLYSYLVEILPYPIRAKGFSLLMFFSKASNFINILVNPIGL